MAFFILLLLPQIIYGLTDSNNVIGTQFESQNSENELKFEYYENGFVGNHLNSKVERNERKFYDYEGKRGIDEKQIREGIEESPKIAQVEKIKPRALCAPENEEIKEKGAQQEITTQEFCNSQVNKCFKYKLNSELFGKTCEQHCVENVSCTSFAIRNAVNGRKLEKGTFCFLAVDKCPKGFMPFNTETKRGLEECENSTFGPITPMKPRTKIAKVLKFGSSIGHSVLWTAKNIGLPLVKSSSLGMLNFTMMFPHVAGALWIFLYFFGWKACFNIAKKLFWFLWKYGRQIALWLWNNPKLALAGFAVIGSGAYYYFPTLLSLLMKALEFLKDLFGNHIKELGEELRKLTGQKPIDCLPQSCEPGGMVNDLKLKNANLGQQVKNIKTELWKTKIELADLTKLCNDLMKNISKRTVATGNFFQNALGAVNISGILGMLGAVRISGKFRTF